MHSHAKHGNENNVFCIRIKGAVATAPYEIDGKYLAYVGCGCYRTFEYDIVTNLNMDSPQD